MGFIYILNSSKKTLIVSCVSLTFSFCSFFTTSFGSSFTWFSSTSAISTIWVSSSFSSLSWEVISASFATTNILSTFFLVNAVPVEGKSKILISLDFKYPISLSKIPNILLLPVLNAFINL